MISDVFLAALRAVRGRRGAGPTLLTRIGTELGAEDPRRFNYALALWSGLLLATCIVGGLILDRLQRLPAPPLTATNCIDEKFKFLHEAELQSVQLLAVGSSATWRNLAMDEFVRVRSEVRPFNAAPCFLHIDQTAYFTGFLMKNMSNVSTVLSIIAVRDFEECPSQETAFFDEGTAQRYIFGKSVPWHLYLTNMRPTAFAQDIIRLRRMRLDPSNWATLRMDAYGSSPMTGRIRWMPPPRFDERCFAALTQLEEIVRAQGARLVIASVPTMPRWRQTFDPDGAITADFRRRLRQALKDPTTLFIDAEAFTASDDAFADPVHLIGDAVAGFNRLIIQRMWRVDAPAADLM